MKHDDEEEFKVPESAVVPTVGALQLRKKATHSFNQDDRDKPGVPASPLAKSGGLGRIGKVQPMFRPRQGGGAGGN